MEPISLVTVVPGLLKICAEFIAFISTAVDAPSTARDVVAEVQAMLGIFRLLNNFIVHFDEQSVDQKSRIRADDLLFVLTDCVCTFSKLDKVLGSLKTDVDNPKSTFSAWDRLKWAAKDGDIAKILQRFQSQKTSLNTLLSVHTWLV